jgi:hypothetical protein
MVSKEIIEEASRHGIVPWAFVRSAWGCHIPDGLVPPINEWKDSKDSKGLNSIYWAEGHDYLWLFDKGKWATVITPAPSSDTLEPGMLFGSVYLAPMKQPSFEAIMEEAERLAAASDDFEVARLSGQVFRHV